MLPKLQYIGKENEKMGFHLIMQILGKIRMCLSPRKNHWWYVTLYVDSQGFTTSPISFNDGYDSLTINLNVHEHALIIHTSKGHVSKLLMKNGLSVAEFWHHLSELLHSLNIDFSIQDRPYDLPITKSFNEITDYYYHQDYVKDAWRAFLWVDGVFKEYSGQFYGKTCPVHLYWHSLDLAVTRFSGRQAPKMDAAARISDKDAYSHECISSGFWLGDENITEACFYSYTYPSPVGLEKENILPKQAKWKMGNGSPMALLKYKDLLQSIEPRKDLLAFMNSTYEAGAKLANWNVEELKVPELYSL